MSLTIACVLKEGGIYTQKHVSRLRQQIIGKISQPYEFYCLNDSPFPGWWAKISLFEQSRFTGRVLYLDLDVDIVGNLDEIADFPWPFGIINDWNGQSINSSVMVWDAGYADSIFTKFKESDMDKYEGGDQHYIANNFISTVKFPKEWCLSYKTHIRGKRIPETAKVIVYHGLPKPWDLK